MQATEIKNLLPGVYRRTWRPGSPLDALLEAMHALQEPDELKLDELPRFLDPRQTPDRFVPELARWVDLDHLFQNSVREGDVSSDPAMLDRLMPSGLGRLRELIANAASLAQWRGTRHGLLMYLQIATGLDSYEVVENCDGADQPCRFHICVHGPAAAERQRPLIEAIIAAEKPAHLTFEFVTAPEGASHAD